MLIRSFIVNYITLLNLAKRILIMHVSRALWEAIITFPDLDNNLRTI